MKKQLIRHHSSAIYRCMPEQQTGSHTKIDACADLLDICNLSAPKYSSALETLCEKLADRLSLIHNTPTPKLEFLKHPPYRLFSQEYDVVEHTIKIQRGLGIDASIATVFKAFSHICTYMQAISSALQDSPIAAKFREHKIGFNNGLIEAAKEQMKKHHFSQQVEENRLAAVAIIQGELARRIASNTNDPDEYDSMRRILANHSKPELDAKLAELEAKRFMLQLRLKHLECCSGQRLASTPNYAIKIIENFKARFSNWQLSDKLTRTEQQETDNRSKLNILNIKHLGIFPALGLPDLTPLIYGK
jgi:hypothetical protein